MRLNGFLVFVIFLVSGASSYRSASAYTLDQMAAALNVLRSELDGNVVCKIDSQILNRLPQLLQARLDALPPEQKPAYLETCETRCSCGFYLDWITKKDPQNPVVSQLEKKSKQLNSQQALACAKNNRWFCKSALLKELKKEADF